MYIGQSKNIYSRQDKHRRFLRNGKHHNIRLQNSWNKYGEASFEFKVLISYPPDICAQENFQEILDKEEKRLIKLYDTFNGGYNLSLGGDGCKGFKHTDEQLLKMSRALSLSRIMQIKTDGSYELIRVQNSLAEIQKKTKYSRRNIKSCCDRLYGHKSAYGFYWMYEADYNDGKFKKSYFEPKPPLTEQERINKVLKRTTIKPVGQFTLDGELKQIFSCSREAAFILGLNIVSIRSCCAGHMNSYSGYLQKYV